MELKLIDLVKKMEQNNPDLEYFEQGTFTMKPVYMKKSNVIKMESLCQSLCRSRYGMYSVCV